MIEAEIFTDKSGSLLGFLIRGHSGYSHQGADIVCAAVSSAAYMAANTILEVIGIGADVIVRDGYMRLMISSDEAKACRDILTGFKLHICSLEEQYSDYLTVNYLEV